MQTITFGTFDYTDVFGISKGLFFVLILRSTIAQHGISPIISEAFQCMFLPSEKVMVGM
jgi:hypothetical protein